jgi:predicted O-methyltransferase YrrM
MPSLRALYAFAIFWSSCLLFLVEPMAAKRLVPLLGGSAAVWTTCLVFFQTMLLLGYALAHWLVSRLSTYRQTLAYLAILGTGLLFSLDVDRPLHPDLVHPATSVFVLLARMIGIPFLALSASSPLLQAWYARSQARGAVLHPPYRLFVLSNFGSLVALASYPAVIEPRATLHTQGVAWCWGLLMYTVVCGAIAWRVKGDVAVAPPSQSASTAESSPETARMVLWIALAACGSVLLCAVTGYLSQNIAAIPLLWIAPLTVYLLSFMLTFNGGRRYPRTLVLLLLAASLGALGYLLWSGESNLNLNISIPLFCAVLLVCCTFAHGEVYRLRPAAQYSTQFYLCIAAGGAIGAFFVGIVAPRIFTGDYELCCALLVTVALALITTWQQALPWRALWVTGTLALCATTVKYVHDYRAQSIVRVRNFYGALRVTEEGGGSRLVRHLYNGTIEHGTQWLQGSMRNTPTTYYARDSGAGLALSLCCSGAARRIGIIGLGAGTLAAYGRAGDVFRFYEINPLVEQMAHRHFTYLGDSRARIETVPGDARVSLATEPPQNYDVLLVDAFSGDAIPVHLLTAEAVNLYLRHLRPGGIIAFHVSNRYLVLETVVQQEADHAGLRSALIESNDDDSRDEYGASWVLVTRDQSFLAQPAVRTSTSEIDTIKGLRLWTDDYNSLLPLLRWRGRSDAD